LGHTEADSRDTLSAFTMTMPFIIHFVIVVHAVAHN
jgi:hypothetical protein